MKRLLVLGSFVVALCVGAAASLSAQGVAAASMNILLTDQSGAPIPGATVKAVHTPSGTVYTGSTRGDGRVTLQGMRVGGPYKVTTAAIGFQPASKDEIYLSLGVTSDLSLSAEKAVVSLQELVVAATKDAVFSSERTGAATSVPKEVFGVLPTIARGLDNFTRLSPQANVQGTGTSFAGQDNRINNITVDGTYFNNSFGLGSAPGARTGVAAISMDAIEQVQINVAPFDVRQSNFVGAGVNTVTKSGTNSFAGSLYYNGRNQSLVGTNAGDLICTSCALPFSFHQLGASLGGPIIKNKLFFFGSYESDANSAPATTFVANTGGQTVTGSTTRVLASDLDSLSAYLAHNFNYTTGPYQGYDFKIPSSRFLGKLDYNLNDRNKLSVRYSMLNSNSDQLSSNSNGQGLNGNRDNNANSMVFQNSNYKIKENNRSLAADLNSSFGGNKANDLILGYYYSDESRDSLSGTFPLIDIQKDGATYMSAGFEPFTPGNQLRYHSTQVQDNFTIFGKNHDLNFGVTAEKYHSDNVFFPGSQSVYVYNSLDDFYADANGYLADHNRTTSPVGLLRFQVRYNNVPGQTQPLQPLDVLSSGAYLQDNWRISKNVKLTFGLRADFHSFDSTALVNPLANAMTFRDGEGNAVQYKTQQFPSATPLWSPRFGFNIDVKGEHKTQIRGGTGIFSGSPPYVWISNQVGQNGILTGLISEGTATAPITNRPFNPNPLAYVPTTVTGAPASSYELDFTSNNFKFSQLWRTDLAIDQKLPWGMTGTAEYIYNKDINGPTYINANLAAATSHYAGVDARPHYPAVNKLNPSVTSAYVIGNESIGYSWIGALSAEKAFGNGFYGKIGYSYGESFNTVDPGSTASTSWSTITTPGDPNSPGLGYSANSPGHRLFIALSKRLEYFKFGATTLSLYYNAFTQGNGSYIFNGDANGDGATLNDLIYIPKDESEMNFKSLTVTGGGPTFTPQQQADAWEAVIKQDSYLSSHRGQYAGRNAVFLSMAKRADFSIVQEVFGHIKGARNSLQFRLDILNVGNLINKSWGLGETFLSTVATATPLASPSTDAGGKLTYTLTTTGSAASAKLITTLLKQTTTSNDVYRLQLGGRYTFF